MTEEERELQELKKQLSGLTKVLSKSNKAVLEGTKSSTQFNNVKKALNQTMAGYRKRVKETGNQFVELSDTIDAAEEDLRSFRKSLKGMPSPLNMVTSAFKFVFKAAKEVGTALVKTAFAFSDVTKSIRGLEEVIDLGVADIPMLGKAAKELAKDIDANVSSFASLAKTGATFGSSIVMLRKAQAEALMPLGKFTDLIANNTPLLAKLFGSVDQGIPQIVGLTNNLRTLTQTEFSKFGLTLDETSEFLTTFLELERARGNVNRMTQGELLDATRSYTKDLVTLSKLTGQNVDELNEQNLAMAADGVFQSQLTKMNAKDAKTLSLGLSALSPGLQKLAKEIITLGAPIDGVSRDLEAMSGGRFSDAIKQFQQDLDPVAFQNAIKTISKDVMLNGEAFGDAAVAGGVFTEALNAVVAQIGTAVDPKDVQASLQAQGDNIGNLLALTTDEVDRFKAELENTRFKFLQPFIFAGQDSVTATENLRLKLQEITEGSLAEFNKLLPEIGKFLGFDTGEGGNGNGTDDNKGFFNFFGGGDAPNNAFDYLGEYDQGSRGFQDFGTGSPAVLHGSEAVVPENTALGNAISILEAIAKNPNTITNNAGDNVSSVTNTTVDNESFTMLNSSMNELLDSNKKMVQHLNTLITIGAMTERNTKSTTNNLANMSGSLV